MSSQQVKKIMVTGSSGYVGNYLLKSLALAHPSIEIIGMSRSGKAREQSNLDIENVSYIKGDCLDIASFEKQLEDVDSVVHTVGVLFESSKNPKLTYKAMNRDAAANMAQVLNEYAKGSQRNFVYISSQKGLPFFPGYYDTKIEAENFILNECPHLKPTIIRPGFVVDGSHRVWSPPLGVAVDLLYNLNELVVKKTPLAAPTDFLFPAKSTKLSTIGYFTE